MNNEKGEGLSGVTILEKGTNNGTATKEDGAFSMDVTSLNAVLVFSSKLAVDADALFFDEDGMERWTSMW